MNKAKPLNTKKKTGFILLVIVIICWVAAPILPFFDIPYKVATITAVVIIGEVLFIITIALLGKEYWQLIKKKVKQFFSFKKYEDSQIIEADRDTITEEMGDGE